MTENSIRQAIDLALAPSLRAILDADYPRFSAAEMTRRRAAVEHLFGEVGLDHLVYCGANRFGSAVQWLTGWPVTAEAVGVLTPGEADALFIQHVNHVPLARRLAAPAEVAWGGGSSIDAAIATLEHRAARRILVASVGVLRRHRREGGARACRWRQNAGRAVVSRRAPEFRRKPVASSAGR